METTKQENSKFIKEELNRIINEKKADISTIARGINYSPSTVSLYLNGQYKGNVEKVENDLLNYIKLFNKKDSIQVKSLAFVETAITKRIFNAANMCQIHGKMGVCFGSPGIGKTTAIRAYQKMGSGVIIVDPFEQTSAREVLKQIADHLKLNYHNNMTLDEFTKNVIKKLEKNKYLIVLDEAENLKVDSFKIIRKIHDRTKNNCGILFIGTQEFRVLLSKVQSGFPYISSRIGYVEKLDILKLEDVEKMVYQYFPKCNSGLIDLIAKNSVYNARNIQNLLDLCLDITQSNKIELNADVIKAAEEKLLI